MVSGRAVRDAQSGTRSLHVAGRLQALQALTSILARLDVGGPERFVRGLGTSVACEADLNTETMIRERLQENSAEVAFPGECLISNAMKWTTRFFSDDRQIVEIDLNPAEAVIAEPLR